MANSTIQAVAVGQRRVEPAEFEIEIRGNRPHIGKSYVAELIRRTLAQHGLNVSVVSGDNDTAMFQGQHPDEFSDNFKGMVAKMTPVVTIIDNNLRTQGKK